MSGTLTLAAPASAELLIASVLGTLTAGKTKQAYAAALEEFFAWITERGEPLSKAGAGRCWRAGWRFLPSING